jgi:hypothetical protein
MQLETILKMHQVQGKIRCVEVTQINNECHTSSHIGIVLVENGQKKQRKCLDKS